MLNTRTSRSVGRRDGPAAPHERTLLSNRLAKNYALQPHDNNDWTHPHCFFHAAIDGLNELGISDNITMMQLRMNVKAGNGPRGSQTDMARRS
jgi:hypothetical protein